MAEQYIPNRVTVICCRLFPARPDARRYNHERTITKSRFQIRPLTRTKVTKTKKEMSTMTK